MEAVYAEEENQHKIVKATIFFQCVFVLIYLAILLLKPENYPSIAEKFGWFALLTSFGLARLYIHQVLLFYKCLFRPYSNIKN